MSKAKTKEQLEAEIMHKAAAIDDMTKHDGWKYLMEICQLILEREKEALSGQSMDHLYYRKIGFLQMFKYFISIPGIIKDKKVREYVLHQGRLAGMKAGVNSPMMFFEGIMKGNAQIRQYFEQSNLQLKKKEEKEFNESQLK